ncbi:MAG: hypothetical protein GXP47_05565 [Acidobacteria bacterium]|nr:hypothetical protein [Acidobacteriota bacterium]
MKQTRAIVSPLFGLRRAAALWRLVLVVWAFTAALSLLPLFIVQGRFAGLLGAIPLSGAAPGDVSLVIMWGLQQVGPALASSIVIALALVTAFTILWHAGATGWQLWRSGEQLRAAEILGMGVIRWWRYARLAMTGLFAIVVLAAALSSPFFMLAKRAAKALLETRMVNLQLAGMAVIALVLWIGWAATLRGAWELAHPRRRSAALAWLEGLLGTLRSPLSSLGTLLLWGALGKVLTLAPLVAGLVYRGFGGTPAWFGLAVVSHLAAAFCWVALFFSFAPVCPLVDPFAQKEEPTGVRRGVMVTTDSAARNA